MREISRNCATLSKTTIFGNFRSSSITKTQEMSAQWTRRIKMLEPASSALQLVAMWWNFRSELTMMAKLSKQSSRPSVVDLQSVRWICYQAEMASDVWWFKRHLVAPWAFENESLDLVNTLWLLASNRSRAQWLRNILNSMKPYRLYYNSNSCIHKQYWFLRMFMDVWCYFWLGYLGIGSSDFSVGIIFRYVMLWLSDNSTSCNDVNKHT